MSDCVILPNYMIAYSEIASKIISDIQQKKINGKLPSIRTLASRYNVSRAPIERAISELRAQGYVASFPRSRNILLDTKKPTNTIHFLSRGADESRNHLFYDAFDVIRCSAGSAYTLSVQSYNSISDEAECLMKILQDPPAGLYAIPVLTDQKLVNPELYESIVKMGVKTIFLMRDVREIPAYSVYYDNASVIDSMFTMLEENSCGVRIHITQDTHEILFLRKTHFDLHYAEKNGCYWIEMPSVCKESDSHILELLIKKFDELRLKEISNFKKIGICCSNELYLYAVYKVLNTLHIENYKLISDGLTRYAVHEFFPESAREFKPDLFNYPDIDYRGKDAGQEAVRLMQYMLERNKQITGGKSLPVYYKKQT